MVVLLSVLCQFYDFNNPDVIGVIFIYVTIAS